MSVLPFMGGGSIAAMAGGVTDADALLWKATVVAAGGAVSTAQLGYVSTLIKSLKAAGSWALTDDYAVHAGENATQALVTLKLRLTMTANSAPTFVLNRGYLGNLAGYLDSKWNPGTGTWQYLRDSARYAVWTYAAGSTDTKALLGNDDDNYSELTIYPTLPRFRAGINQTTGPDNNEVNSVGWVTAARTSSTAVTPWINGAAQAAQPKTSIALANRNFYLLGANSSTGVKIPCDAGISASAIGAPLTDAAMSLAEYNAFRTYMTSVGVP